MISKQTVADLIGGNCPVGEGQKCFQVLSRGTCSEPLEAVLFIVAIISVCALNAMIQCSPLMLHEWLGVV